MRFFSLLVAVVLLSACQVIRPFGDATTYKSFFASSRPGLDARYHCMRSALSAEGYSVELIFPERDTPNFFDVSRDNKLIARLEMYQLTGENSIDITLSSGLKQTNEAIARAIEPCVSD